MLRGIGNMLFSICSQTYNVKGPRGSLVNLWGQVRTLRGLFLVSRTGDDPSPCVDSNRLRVYIQNVSVYAGTTRTCVSTCARCCRYTRRRFVERCWLEYNEGHDSLSISGGRQRRCVVSWKTKEPPATPRVPSSNSKTKQVKTNCG